MLWLRPVFHIVSAVDVVWGWGLTGASESAAVEDSSEPSESALLTGAADSEAALLTGAADPEAVMEGVKSTPGTS